MLQSNSEGESDRDSSPPVFLTNETAASQHESSEDQDTENHSLVRRYKTEDLDSKRVHLELQMARRKYKSACKLYQQLRYFDCLERVSDALDCFNTGELPNANLKVNQAYFINKKTY